MRVSPRPAVTLGSFAALVLLGACAGEGPTIPQSSVPVHAAVSSSSTTLPSGERQLGQSSIEPAYDDVTGNLTYLLTPLRSPFPSKANAAHATAPLYLVEYPPGSNPGTLSCMGVPGNCPDHDGEVATAATQIMPGVYGTNPMVVPGHDHLVAVPGSGGDFNVAWEVHEILFTSLAAAQANHPTTKAQIDALKAAHQVVDVDLGFAFTCVVVPATVYWQGT